MTSFTVKPNGTISVKPKGKIQYCFKGMFMHPENGTAVLSADNILTVSRDSDGQLFDFIQVKRKWLLKNNTNQGSLLFGTQFIFDT